METTGSRIAHLIKERKLTQAELGKKIGISQATLSQYISGARNPSDRTIRDIARVLRVRESWLRDGEGEMLDETPRTVAAELAEAYSLTPAVAHLLDVVAQVFTELDEDTASGIMERLRLIVNNQTDVIAAHDSIMQQLTALGAFDDTAENQAQ